MFPAGLKTALVSFQLVSIINLTSSLCVPWPEHRTASALKTAAPLSFTVEIQNLISKEHFAHFNLGSFFILTMLMS